MQPLQTLLDRASETAAAALPEALAAAYGGEIGFPASPPRGVWVFANFVSTLDGIVSYRIPGRAGGDEISGFSEEDRFVMGLLRSCADAVLVGSGTLKGDPGAVRTPEAIWPPMGEAFAQLRAAALGNDAAAPINAIVTATGLIDPEEAVFHTPGVRAVILTTAGGRERLLSAHGERLAEVEIRVAEGEAAKVSPAAALKALHDEFGVRRLLTEGGPTLLSSFLAEGLLDELFLTLSPRIAGREASEARLSLAEGALFSPEASP
ncbi:MAG: dihydrofolate reductase family protein, partial [Caulobacteraceae bacterium]